MDPNVLKSDRYSANVSSLLLLKKEGQENFPLCLPLAIALLLILCSFYSCVLVAIALLPHVIFFETESTLHMLGRNEIQEAIHRTSNTEKLETDLITALSHVIGQSASHLSGKQYIQFAKSTDLILVRWNPNWVEVIVQWLIPSYLYLCDFWVRSKEWLGNFKAPNTVQCIWKVKHSSVRNK